MAGRALKVFRTPIGFHDAYVAVSSRKAALEAWGASADLFARGAAEQVTDDALMRAPLADPGTVIRLVRGTDAEHLAALGATEEAVPGQHKTEAKRPDRPARDRGKRPSRTALDRAEAALEAARADHAAAIADFARREAALRTERRVIETRQAAQTERLERQRDTAKSSYAAKLDRWIAD